MNESKPTQADRLRRIDAIAAELRCIPANDDLTIRCMASAAKAFRAGDPVVHIGNPLMSGVVGFSVSEGLNVAVTDEGNLQGAKCFCDPRNLRLNQRSGDATELLREARDRLVNPVRHRFWGAGEPDCPKEIKASNGELHTLRCKVCGSEKSGEPCDYSDLLARIDAHLEGEA